MTVEPAADALIRRLESQLENVPVTEVECIPVGAILSFIARIHAERAKTIQECISVAVAAVEVRQHWERPEDVLKDALTALLPTAK